MLFPIFLLTTSIPETKFFYLFTSPFIFFQNKEDLFCRAIREWLVWVKKQVDLDKNLVIVNNYYI
ncbi:MAG: hypothetical protein C0407_15440 [Desulfobacca sp.]|nr:hypothetical protein [Desulfobacca sp.]